MVKIGFVLNLDESDVQCLFYEEYKENINR